jgi:hypothetical protein
LGIEPVTSGSAARNSDHKTTEAVSEKIEAFPKVEVMPEDYESPNEEAAMEMKEAAEDGTRDRAIPTRCKSHSNKEPVVEKGQWKGLECKVLRRKIHLHLRKKRTSEEKPWNWRLKGK